MDTVTQLLKHFDDQPYISLEAAGAICGYSAQTMKEKIDAGIIRLPYFNLDGRQKSTKLVRVEDMAAILDDRAQQARKEFEKLWR